jgi:hypothetical protein
MCIIIYTVHSTTYKVFFMATVPNNYLYLQDSTGRLKGAAFPRLRAHQRCEVARGQVLGSFGFVVVLLQLVLPEVAQW